MRGWVNLLWRRPAIMVFLATVLYFSAICALNPAFFSTDTVFRIVFNDVVLSIVAIGTSFVMITKNIDVSVGSLLGLAATLSGAVLNSSDNIGLAILVALSVGLAGGIINGVGVAHLGVSAIIMTLGGMAIYRGLLIMYTGGRWIQTIPESFVNVTRIGFLGINVVIWLVIILVIGSHLLLTRTRIGRYIYAVGNNAEGANLQGIRVRSVTVVAYALCGLFTGLASLIYVSQIGAVPNMAGVGLETQAIAAAVIGGVSLGGGKGDVIGSALGAMLLQTISYSLVYLRVPGFWNEAISGAMLLLVIMFSSAMNQYANARKRAEAQERTKESAAIAFRAQMNAEKGEAN